VICTIGPFPALPSFARENLAAVGRAPTSKDPCYLVADKGHHSPESLTEFDGAPRTTRIAEPKTAKA